MKVIILGSGVCIPSVKRGSPGYYLEINEEKFLIDGGSGSLQALTKAGVDYSDIDGIFYTHLHVDHTADLIPFLIALKHVPFSGKKKDFFLYGPVGFKKFFEKLCDAYGESFIYQGYTICLKEIKDGDHVTTKELKVLARHVQHTENSLGYRFTDQEGKTIVFSGDSGYCNSLIDLSRLADVAILESSAPDGYKIESHLTPSLAGKIASQANVKRLVLSHIYPITDNYPLVEQCGKYFDGKIELARDFLNILL